MMQLRKLNTSICYPGYNTLLGDIQSFKRTVDKWNLKQSSDFVMQSKFYQIVSRDEVKFVRKVDQMIYDCIPEHTSSLKQLYKYFQYPNKGFYSRFIYATSKATDFPIDENQAKLAFCFETIHLGIFLHRSIENRDHLLQGQSWIRNLMMRTVLDKLNDKKLVLAGDFFHTKSSLMSSFIKDDIRIPLYLSILEEDASKSIFQDKDELKQQYHSTASTIGYAFLLSQILRYPHISQESVNENFLIGTYLDLIHQGYYREHAERLSQLCKQQRVDLNDLCAIFQRNNKREQN